MKVTARTDGPVSIAYEIVGAGPLVVFLAFLQQHAERATNYSASSSK
jgi:hypothetical protein